MKGVKKVTHQINQVISILLVASLFKGHCAGTWVGTGTGVLLTTAPVSIPYDLTAPNSVYGYGLMSTPRMTGTNEFVFFSSSDTNIAATATTPLRIG
mgnify:CR=1 FL=1